MQFVGGKKALKTSLLFDWINFPAFLTNSSSGELCIYKVVLFQGLSEFALCLPPVGRTLLCAGSLGSWGWTPEQWGSGPLPRAATGASASPQDHREVPAVQTSSASSLLGISSQALFVCAFGLATREGGNTWRTQGVLHRECLLCSTCFWAQQKMGTEGRGGWKLFAVRQITAGTRNPQGRELCLICAAFASWPPWSHQGEHREVAAAVSLSDPQLSGQTSNANEPRATLSCSR